MALLGFLLVNSKGAICLTRYGMEADDADIAAVYYIPASRIAGARLADGSEEVFVDQIEDATHQALVNSAQILVVHMSEESKPIKEYKAPIEKK